MDVNHEQRLEQLRWTGLGQRRARPAAARSRTLVCEPTCANGLIEHSQRR